MRKEMMQTKEMIKVYEKIKKQRKKYGKFVKCLFHIHTPASYDFRLLQDKEPKWYKQLTEEGIYNIADKELSLGGIRFSEELIKEKGYNNSKEYLSYLMQASQIVQNKIEIVLVCDHNTVKGIQKLEKALEVYCKSKNIKEIPIVLFGVEISCADLFHVVGIFENKIEKINEVNSKLEEIIMSQETGTYETSKRVIEMINSLKGNAYIAHINTANGLKEKMLSNAYKNELFKSNYLKLIGVNAANQIEPTKKRLSHFTTKEFAFVLDNDTHGIYNFDKNTFWIKGKKKDFSIIKNIIIDSNISIEYNIPQKPINYIEGIYINPGERGFLKGKTTRELCINFSESMNCFIGGRGTGKSTILNIIDFMSNKDKNIKEYNLIYQYDSIWMLCNYENEEYFIRYLSPDLDECSNLTEYAQLKFKNDYSPNKIDSIRRLMKKTIQVYKIIPNQKVEELSLKEQERITNKLFSSTYSINNLIEQINRNEINEFIKKTILKNETFNKKILISKKMKISNQINNIELELAKKEKNISDIISNFNNKQLKKLKIVNTVKEFDYAYVMELLNINNNGNYFEKMNIRNDDLISYVYKIINSIGILPFLTKLYFNTKELNKIISVYSYTSVYGTKEIDSGITQITNDNVDILFNKIHNRIISNEKRIIDILNEYFKNCDEYELNFNINNREDKQGEREIFKKITELSLGQKVVAIMSFILAYSDYSDDYTPFIVDQPEDNLDNMYIYLNLVKQFRDIKEKRQVIIATHNSTIVTNSKAEEVIVMESDNKNGWIVNYGYPTEDKIKRHIINCLEGGIPSFVHKINIYEDLLSKSNNS